MKEYTDKEPAVSGGKKTVKRKPNKYTFKKGDDRASKANSKSQVVRKRNYKLRHDLDAILGGNGAKKLLTDIVELATKSRDLKTLMKLMEFCYQKPVQKQEVTLDNKLDRDKIDDIKRSLSKIK